MAKQEIIRLVDDLDGGEATVTVEFAVDGSSYEIDLSEANADRLRKGLEEFITHARRGSGSRARQAAAPSRTPRTPKDAQQSRELRGWAREYGIAVSDRGRIPELVRMLHRATGGGAPTDEQITQFGVQRA